ncbi:MAG TPA: lipid-A-disaccharide synthase, partial [Xanthobacteraceae bacterium]
MLRVFIVVGEPSGDLLGAQLMRTLQARLGDAVSFGGVGGDAMAAAGFSSIFPLGDTALMGFAGVATGLRRIMRRIREAADAVIAAQPDVLVIIDSPDFTHRVARRVRAAAPNISIVNYVSPSVWAWRPGRARKMRGYIDHVLALLPFEPDAHARLGGPPCTFVGHPLAERVQELRPDPDEARRRGAHPPVLLVLPGSRHGEVRRLLDPFGEAVRRVRGRLGEVEVVLPTLPHLVDEVRAATQPWDVRPTIVVGEDDKHAAFRIARAALAASGTVTLELALAGVPTVAAYRVASIEAVILRRLIRVPSVILANLVLDENVVPEYLQEACTPENLADALLRLLPDTPERTRQVQAFERLD